MREMTTYNNEKLKELYAPFLETLSGNKKGNENVAQETFPELMGNIVSALDLAYRVLNQGTNQNSAQCIANKKKHHPQNEEPLTIMFYQLQATPTTHIGAYYNGRRLDFFPRDVPALPNEFEQQTLKTAITVAKVMKGRSVPERHLEGLVPQDLSAVECYNIYPSELGIKKEDLTKAIDAIRSQTEPYNLYENNCAHQIMRALEMCKPNCTESVEIALPANLKNWAKQNGHKISPELAPLNNDKRDLTILLKWLENPNAMYYETISKNPNMTKQQKEKTKLRYKVAKKHPITLIEKINNLIEKNIQDGNEILNRLIYETINKTNKAKRKIIKSKLIQHPLIQTPRPYFFHLFNRTIGKTQNN